MENLRTILFLFIFLILAGCQAKQGDSDGDLFSGHLPTTNSFTLASMSTKTYAATESISFEVNFPFDMIIDTTGGNPRLKITVGATTRYATYAAQADLRKLVFNYTVAASENDTDGIDVNALELNGSTLKFDKDGTPINCDVASLISRNVSNVKVDTTSPTITAFALTNVPGMYNEGESIIFQMTFSEAVVVTGIPKFTVTFSTGGTVDINYLSGTGSNILIFSYIVGPTVADTNGFNSINSPIVNGTIKDTVGNSAGLNFSAFTPAVVTYSSSVHVSGLLPNIIATDFPDDRTYVAAEQLDFILEFNHPVTVTGAPYINIDIGGVTKQATYNSGSTTNFLTFSYSTIPGDVDANGITVSNSIVQNSGNIVLTSSPGVSYFSDALNNVIPLPNTSGIILNAVQPQATAVNSIDITAPTWGGPAVDNVWMIGQEFNLAVTFNTQMYVTQTSGTPYIPITIGATTKQATYLSGGNGQTTLIFRYVVQEGDLDVDGAIALGNIVLNNGNITDSANTNTLLTLPVASIAKKIDAVRPLISSVTPPANDTYSTDTAADYQDMIFTVNWSEPVNYSTSGSISMDVGGSPTPLVSYNNNVAGITHRPTASLATKNDTNGVTLGTSVTGPVVKDQAGNTATSLNFSAPNTTGVLVDTTLPVVNSISAITSTGSYKQGDTIDFSVTFSETVTIVAAGGYPRIPITVGAATAYMVARFSGTGTSHTFRYTVSAGENDTDGIASLNTVQNNSTTAYVRDAGRNYAVTGVAQAFASHLVDTTAPTITSVTKTANGTYETGDNIDITLNYSENVNVDTTGGTPRIAVIIGGSTRYLNYFSGTGTTAIKFRYTLTTADFDVDGLPSAVSTLSLNSGTINDVAGNASPTTFTSQNLSGILAVFLNTDLWVESAFVNKAKAGSPGVTNSGAIGTLDTCGASPCRKFDGDGDTLSASLTGVFTVFIVFKTPANAILQDRQIFGSFINLNASWNDFDIATVSSKIYLDSGSQQGSATSFNVNMAENSTHVLQVDFDSARTLSGNLVETGFNGSIGEIWAITGSLTTAQKDIIRNYLISKY